MKFTHRVAGPRKGNGKGFGTVNIRKPPKPKLAAPVSKRGKHVGAFATIADTLRGK